ncbi:MAG: translation initiation factor IF-6 [Candidatus Hydrothermarchaeota archaeon]|nr:translation initiation factor IF-6 [Candidatus Hydrothermarchaeota archaeon]
MLRLIAYNRNPNIGVFAVVNDNIAVLPTTCPGSFVSSVKEALGVEVVRTNICGTSLVGVMMAMNNNGVLLSKHAEEREILALKESGLEVGIIEDKYTALGNLVLLNDCAAIISGLFGKRVAKTMEDVLDCEVAPRNLWGFKTVGSLGIATNKGALIHPLVKEGELEWVEDVLGVEVDLGTVNRGVGFIKTGLIVNKNGALIGDATTGPEIVRIEDSLGYL